MRRRLAPVAFVVLAAAAAPGALAGNGPGTATPFKALFGSISCSGVRLVTSAPRPTVEDLETCTGVPLSILAVGRYTIPIADFAWYSDYDGALAVSGTIVITAADHGTATSKITAFYT